MYNMVSRVAERDICNAIVVESVFVFIVITRVWSSIYTLIRQCKDRIGSVRTQDSRTINQASMI